MDSTILNYAIWRRRTWMVSLIAICTFAWCPSVVRCEAPPREWLIAVYSYLDDPSSLSGSTLASQLRPFGADALDRLLSIKPLLEKERDNAESIAERATVTTRIQRLDRLCDEVASQTWSSVSRLFWYTNLDEARRDAIELRRPILSLRIDGRLNGDHGSHEALLLIATVYCNQQLAEELRSRYVLHWQPDLSRSLFEAETSTDESTTFPLAATDRKLGSRHVAHYLMTSDGRPVAVIPRCVSPAFVLKWLAEFHEVAVRPSDTEDGFRQQLQVAHGKSQVARMLRLGELLDSKGDLHRPLATELAALAATGQSIQTHLSEVLWQRLVEHTNQFDDSRCRLDATSTALLASADFAMVSGWNELPPRAEIERRIAIETTRTQFQDLYVIDSWYSPLTFALDIELLNAKIFQTFFQ